MKANILRMPSPPRKRHEDRVREDVAALRADIVALRRLLASVLRALPPDPFDGVRDEQA